MDHQFLTPVYCPFCQTFHTIRCSHAQSGSEADKATIVFSEKLAIRQKGKLNGN